MDQPANKFDLIDHFNNGIWNAEHQKRLTKIGDELNKVRLYANARNTNADMFSQAIVWLTLSSYFAGLAPIMRIESALFLAKDFRNEYAYALALRSYIEIAGRVHKGIRLWKQYEAKKTDLSSFHNGVSRLMAKFRPEGAPKDSVFKEVIGNDGKPRGGYNVMTFVESLKDKLPLIDETYDALSTYVHGDMWEQMSARKLSWFYDLKMDDNPIFTAYESEAIKLREVAFEALTSCSASQRPSGKGTTNFLRRRRGMLTNLLIVILLACSGYLVYWAVSYSAWIWILPAIVTAACAVCLFMGKRWAAYLWHAIALTVAVIWLVMIGKLAFTGWPYHSLPETVISLVPGMLLLIVCVIGSIVVAKRFRSKSGE